MTFYKAGYYTIDIQTLWLLTITINLATIVNASANAQNSLSAR